MADLCLLLILTAAQCRVTTGLGGTVTLSTACRGVTTVSTFLTAGSHHTTLASLTALLLVTAISFFLTAWLLVTGLLTGFVLTAALSRIAAGLGDTETLVTALLLVTAVSLGCATFLALTGHC